MVQISIKKRIVANQNCVLDWYRITEANIYNNVTRISCLDLFTTLLLALWHKIVQKVVTNDSFQVFLGLVVKCLVVDLGSKGIEMYSLIAAIECTQFTYPVEQDPRDVLFGRIQLLCPQDVKNKVSHTFTAAGTDSDILERRLADLVVRHALQKKGSW